MIETSGLTKRFDDITAVDPGTQNDLTGIRLDKTIDNL